MKKFDQQPKFGDDGFILQYRTTLDNMIDQEFAVFEQTNQTQLVCVLLYVFINGAPCSTAHRLFIFGY